MQIPAPTSSPPRKILRHLAVIRSDVIQCVIRIFQTDRVHALEVLIYCVWCPSRPLCKTSDVLVLSPQFLSIFFIHRNSRHPFQIVLLSGRPFRSSDNSFLASGALHWQHSCSFLGRRWSAFLRVPRTTVQILPNLVSISHPLELIRFYFSDIMVLGSLIFP